MPQPFLTIGIASYNYLQYLDKALEQIKKQSFQNIEILYCDDGSTDGSVERIKEIMQREKDMTIRLIEGKHEGLLANRNRIIQNAAGKYLMICDADDYMLDNCLEKLCVVAEKSDADCVIGGFCEITDDGKMLKQHIPTSNASKWLYTWHHGQIYRLDIVRNNKICFEQVPDDVFYLQQIHQYSRKVVFVQDCVYAWCRHSDSTSGDYVTNEEWHPVNLWRRIASFISEVRDEEGKNSENDCVNLNYYLYKWYYFNITDLWREDKAQIKEYICSMRREMKRANPGYLRWNSARKIAKAGDTGFARGAVMCCLVLEKIHMIYLVILARKLQYRLRE